MAPGPGKDTAMSETFQGSQDYVASEELMRAVNIAMVLQKPLLIKGEPGTGKTVLAEAIAKSLGKELIIWNIKSTTKAQDGLYVYDVVQRLYDSQFGGEGVDDIEKADLEFPNDLLWELDRMEFHIPETGRTVTAKHRPIVIITSNAEKELPDAFLRRCVFHYIEFPDRELMAEIVNVHFQDLDQHLLDQVLEAFYRIRSLPQIKKKPSTSEIIDWIQALIHGGYDPDRVVAEVPYLGVLLKKNEDIDALRKSWR